MWLKRLFCSPDVPYHLSGRIWDQMLLLGPEILYRVGVAIFSISEDKLLASRDEEEVTATLLNLSCATTSEVVLNVAWGLPINEELLEEIQELTSIAA